MDLMNRTAHVRTFKGTQTACECHTVLQKFNANFIQMHHVGMRNFGVHLARLVTHLTLCDLKVYK